MEERLENVVRRSEQMGWQLVLPHLASASAAAAERKPSDGRKLVGDAGSNVGQGARQIGPEEGGA